MTPNTHEPQPTITVTIFDPETRVMSSTTATVYYGTETTQLDDFVSTGLQALWATMVAHGFNPGTIGEYAEKVQEGLK